MAKLLVVEDDPDVSTMLELVLSADGHEVRVARNGEEGVQLVTEDRPDVAIVDIQMPMLSGPGMILRLFAIDCGTEEVPIVFISGHVELDKIAEEIGTPYKIGKPFQVDALLSLVQRALTERIIPRPKDLSVA